MARISRRTLIQAAGAAATLPLLGRPALAADKIKVGFIFLGPIGDYGWTWAHNKGRMAIDEALGDKVETVYVENVAEDASRHSGDPRSCAAGLQADLHDLLRLHGPDHPGRQRIPGREVRTLHRLQARRQRRDLQFEVPRRPRRSGHHRRQDVEVRHARLSRLLQGAGSGARGERVRAVGAEAEPGCQGQAGADRLAGSIRRRKPPPPKR